MTGAPKLLRPPLNIHSIYNKPHVVVQDFTKFTISAKHFQLFEGTSLKKNWVVLWPGG